MTIDTLKPNHFEDFVDPDEDAEAVEVHLSDDVKVDVNIYSSSESESEPQASNVNGKSTFSRVLWSFGMLAIIFVSCVSGITVFAKNQQQKKIAEEKVMAFKDACLDGDEFHGAGNERELQATIAIVEKIEQVPVLTADPTTAIMRILAACTTSVNCRTDGMECANEVKCSCDDAEGCCSSTSGYVECAGPPKKYYCGSCPSTPAPTPAVNNCVNCLDLNCLTEYDIYQGILLILSSYRFFLSPPTGQPSASDATPPPSSNPTALPSCAPSKKKSKSGKKCKKCSSKSKSSKKVSRFLRGEEHSDHKG